MQRLRWAPWAVIVAGCGGSVSTAQEDATIDTSGDTSGDTRDGSTGIDAEAPCGDARCAADEICIRGRCAGCCDLPPSCVPIPTGCSGELSCGCFSKDPCGGCTSCQSVEADGIHCGNCLCTCSAPWTPIDTPDGPRRIADLREGDLVYSVHRGQTTIVPIARIGRRAAPNGHSVVRVTLEGGEVIEMSGAHPTGDGRALRSLVAGDRLGEMRVAAVETVPYVEPFTYDVLPASDSGTYFSSGAWLGSTMHRSWELAKNACPTRRLTPRASAPSAA